jgi:hypothetical protein
MRRVALCIVLALMAVACGDDSSTTGGPTTTAASTTTTAAPGTTAAPATTAAPTTTADAVAARVAAAAALAGVYTGEWHNNTFGSTGAIDAALTVDEAAATAELTVDLGGNVFGASDPDPFTVAFDLSAGGPYAGSNDLLGEFTVEVEADGHVVITAPAVPGLGLEVIMEADIADGVVTGTYDIPGLAEGVFDATRS